MTRHSDFKDLVRARMRATGQPYTAARADLLRERDGAAAPPPQDSAPSPAGATATPGPDVQDPTHPSPETTATTGHSDEWHRAHAEYRRTLQRFVRNGRVVSVPARRRARVFVLLHLVALFHPGRTYREPEVNEVLRGVVDDWAFWRRELVEYGYLQRETGRYWLPAEAPARDRNTRQEIPAWEAVWLPAHLRRDNP
ncbi:DUF2087 domain-containing protein [Kocuria sp.]|uniref:DUF2087 domain-containing protein n=1 Tax=Kocuria sp. TaxID=1871328 RepID=UPI0026DBA476|nr:DUF2087 domain-containing protein [Kocuria sp.]MDO4918805.1 DUF2087 domain-containing protein [Kocuria sp.]